MPGLSEILRSLQGSYMLIRRDLDGFNYFNRTAEGFWRSFAAIVFVAPIYFLYSFSTYEMGVELTGGTSAAFSEGPGYAGDSLALALQWIGFPVAMVFVARLLQLSHLYAGYIIVYNWSSILVMTVIAIPVLLFQIGLFSATTASIANIFLLIPVLYFRWFITLTALDIRSAMAVAIVGLDFVLSMLLLDLAHSLTG